MVTEGAPYLTQKPNIGRYLKCFPINSPIAQLYSDTCCNTTMKDPWVCVQETDPSQPVSRQTCYRYHSTRHKNDFSPIEWWMCFVLWADSACEKWFEGCWFHSKIRLAEHPPVCVDYPLRKALQFSSCVYSKCRRVLKLILWNSAHSINRSIVGLERKFLMTPLFVRVFLTIPSAHGARPSTWNRVNDSDDTYTHLFYQSFVTCIDLLCGYQHLSPKGYLS